MPADPLWVQFRRLLLGTVIEVLQDAGLDVDLGALSIAFDPGSAFNVPRLDNHMRFVGRFSAPVSDDAPIDDARLAALDRALRAVWPDIVGVVALPIGDRLTVSANHVDVRLEGGVLHVAFDLVAD